MLEDVAVKGTVGVEVVVGAQLWPSEELTCTGHAVSTCSCVEATVRTGSEASQEARREDTFTAPGSAM